MTETTMESIRAWSVREAGQFLGRAVLVALVVYLVARLPASSVAEVFDSATPYWVVAVFLTVVVLGYVVVRSRWSGWKLVGALTLLYAGLQVVSFVELYLYELETAQVTLSNVGWSLLKAPLTVIAVVAGFGGVRGESSPPSDERLQFGVREWAWKLPLLAGVFLLAMIAGGLVLFSPVAQFVDPQGWANYEILDPPAWVLPFQLIRGALFTAFLLPIVYLFSGGYRETQLTVALAFAWLLSWGMIIPTETIPGRLWIAHFIEVFISMFIFALLLVPVVYRSHSPLVRLTGKERPESIL
ncbi:hypothetical protein [Natrinema gelatinilyticum]|uniref:hypothetical protein n=1 Tax=Natrinema gelatinilyticum TaxID=2961571 RepID=UPI0020C5A6F9|nr:hypothetical protein [Natrinema gelatinilyticum]